MTRDQIALTILTELLKKVTINIADKSGTDLIRVSFIIADQFIEERDKDPRVSD